MIISLPSDPKPWRLLRLAYAIGYTPRDPHYPVTPKSYPTGPCVLAQNWEFYMHLEAGGPPLAPTNADLLAMVTEPEILEMKNMMGLFGG